MLAEKQHLFISDEFTKFSYEFMKFTGCKEIQRRIKTNKLVF